MKVGVSGTFDVDNYGDVLFPLVTSKILDKYDVLPLSPTSSNPSYIDSLSPNEINSKSINEINALVVGGGNIIRTSSSYLDNYVFNEKENTAYSNLWLSITLSNLDNNVPIVWNCPGVAEVFDEELHDIISSALNRINYISVRDELSKKILENINKNCNISVVPDSVWAISDLFPKENLRSDFYNVIGKSNLDKDYIAFHFNSRYLKGNSTIDIVENIKYISEKYNSVPILISLGNCHEDNVLIKEISNSIKFEHICISEPESLRQCVSVLAFSKAYFGSSMHGLITSSSYGNMALCVAEDKIKFDGIQDLFFNNKVYYSSWNDVISNLDHFDIDQRRILANKVKNSNILKLEEHWNKIKSILDDCSNEKDFLSADLLNKFNDKISTLKIISFEKSNSGLKKEIRSLERDLNKSRLEIIELKTKLSLIHIRIADKLARNVLSVPYAPQILRRLKQNYTKIINQYRQFKFKHINAQAWEMDSTAISEVKKYEREKKGRKVAVVTALYGGYDNLTLPLNICDDFDYFCFTDTKQDTFGVWNICSVPYYNSEPTRIARYVKTHLNELFPSYDYIIWVDGNVRFNHHIEKLLSDFKESDEHIALIKHPIRNCVYEEADKCIDLNKDSSRLIHNQIEHYRKIGLPKNLGMYETNVYIVRNNDDEKISKFYRTWWNEIKLRSRRDQMSVTYSLRQCGIKVKYLLDYGKCVREDPNFEIYHHQKSRYLQAPKDLLPLSDVRQPNFEYVENKQDMLDTSVFTCDVIICVYNALDDVKLCVESVFKDMENINEVIFVNDCSNDETTDYLSSISGYDKVKVIHNETNQGYTKSANIGLKASAADLRILLNSDTVVTNGWVKKLKFAAFSDDRVGIVGPISNAASNQSVPDVKGSKNQTAINTLPNGFTPESMNELAESFNSRVYPIVPLIHGFCIGIKASVIHEIGYFDDVNFARYYGEENDYCLRAYLAGFEHRVAIDTFIFHSKSKSIEEEERIIHMDKAGRKLRDIYGSDEVKGFVLQVENNPVLVNLRSFFKSKV
ncbi:MAG: glycosyltransferase [Vibrio sp.]